jgi:hypothetical protein
METQGRRGRLREVGHNQMMLDFVNNALAYSLYEVDKIVGHKEDRQEVER